MGDPLAGKVLVAKVGMQEQFEKILSEMVRVANSPLSWDGHADMMFNAKVFPECKTKEEVKQLLQDSFLAKLMSVAEWVTEEESEKRKIVSQVLYESKD